jgi:hypothetical protein
MPLFTVALIPALVVECEDTVKNLSCDKWQL